MKNNQIKYLPPQDDTKHHCPTPKLNKSTRFGFNVSEAIYAGYKRRPTVLTNITNY